MIAAPFLVAILAFLLFGLATDGHHRKWRGGPCSQAMTRLLRIAAWAGLAVGFGLSFLAWGAVYGAIGWVGSVMMGAAITFCGLNFLSAPRDV